MILSVPVLVTVDKRQVYELFLPGISARSFRGISLAELLDDVSLHLMENIPKESARRMPIYQFCPHIEVRKVKITVELPGPARKKPTFSGRLTTVVTRWPEDGFYVACVPRLGLETFAVERTAYLESGLTRFVAGQAKRGSWSVEHLEARKCRAAEYLEILSVETELPSVLPSSPAKPKRKKKRKKTSGKQKSGQKGARGRPKAEKRKRRPVPPVTLRQVGNNLTHRAIDGRISPTFGRDAVVEQILRQLERPGAAILLVGPHGVGKTAIVHEVVRRLAGENRPLLERSDIWGVDGNRIIAGMSVVGAWEKRVKDMVAELEARRDILYVADLPTLVYTGRSAHSDSHVAQYLEPHVARQEIRIIGECTAERLEATREEAPGFFARFHIIQVAELSERATLTVLVHALRQLEADDQVAIEPEVLETILALTRRFARHQCHPGKAVDLLHRLVSDFQEVEKDDLGRRKITRQKLIDFFVRQTGLPGFVLWEQQSRSYRDIRAHFEDRIIGQAAAVDAAAAVVTTLQQGLNDPHRPLATMLFVGPTGVGKTETAKAMAAYLFGSSDRLVRFDMSEFRETYSTARLFGDRFRPEGELTRKVEQNPFSVVLFDEIEKAHPSVFDALLQVLGEGRLTNSAGRTTDFCNTIVIMTSNLGVKAAQHSMGFAQGSVQSSDLHFRKAAEAFFRPEFFNRIDRIVPFRSLVREDLGPLVRRSLLDILGRRGLRRSGVLVQVEPELIDVLIDQGFEPRYGARSLKRTLEQRLTVPLARHLVTQPVDRTTLVHLYRYGDDIGMQLWALEDAEVAGGRRRRRIADWEALEARYAAISTAVGALDRSEAMRSLRTVQSELVAAFNRDELDPSQWSRMHIASDLLGGLEEVRKSVDEFRESYLASYDYFEAMEVVGDHSLVENRPPRPSVVVQEIPLPIHRRSIFAKAVAELDEIEARYAAIWHRSTAVQQPEETALLRFLPATDDSTALEWARRVARGFALFWGRWADVQTLERDSGEWTKFVRAANPGGRRVFADRGDAWALLLRGFGIAGLVGAEEGFFMDSYYVGPDLICNLARVENVLRQDVRKDVSVAVTESALARLGELDRRAEEFRRARQSGRALPNPLPRLPLRRRFAQGECRDPETKVEIRVDSSDSTDSWGGSRTLAQGLERVALARIAAKIFGDSPESEAG